MIRRNNSISVLLILILSILHGTNVKSFTLPSPLQKAVILAEGLLAKQKVNQNLDPTIQTKFKVESDETFAAQKSNDGATTTTTFSHALWDSALKKHATYVGDIDGITTTLVDYVGMSTDPDVLRYTQALATVDLEQLGASANNSANELLALYINAYNCFCIGHVTKYYLADPKHRLPSTITAVTKTMTDYKKTDIWDVPAGKIGRRTVTLNEIEHTILRSCWDDPRIHAAIVCASASCPNLRSEAFVGARINAQLDDQAQNWVSDTNKGIRYNPNKSQQLLVSRIFLWFKDDFQSNYGGPLAWAQQYASRGGKRNDKDDDDPKQQQLAAWSKLSTDDYEKNVEYFPYNWKLNDRRWERQD